MFSEEEFPGLFYKFSQRLENAFFQLVKRLINWPAWQALEKEGNRGLGKGEGGTSGARKARGERGEVLERE